MADLSNLFSSLFGIGQQLSAANMMSSAAQSQAATIRTGGEIAAQGALMSAAGFRSSAEAVRGATEFNLGVDAINNHRRMKATSRQLQRTLGRQTTQIASRGIAQTSKSALMIRNESLDIFQRAMLNLKVDAENQRRSRIFQSQIQQTNLENQARAAEYRAAAERVMASNRAAEAAFQGEISQFRARQKVVKSIPTLLSQLTQR